MVGGISFPERFCKLNYLLSLCFNLSCSFYSLVFIILLYHMSGLIKPYRLLDFHIVTKGEFLLKCNFFFRSLSYHIFLQLNGFPEFCECRLMCNFAFSTYFQSFVSIKKWHKQTVNRPKNPCIEIQIIIQIMQCNTDLHKDRDGIR